MTHNHAWIDGQNDYQTISDDMLQRATHRGASVAQSAFDAGWNVGVLAAADHMANAWGNREAANKLVAEMLSTD